MSFTPLDYLRHMLTETNFLVERASSLTRSEFLDDQVLRRAFVRSIEVIGEAARHVPTAFRETHPQIEWRAISGMRDRLIHGYFGIDYDIVWNVASREAVLLQLELERILAEAGD